MTAARSARPGPIEAQPIRVTLGMPLHNGAPHLRQALDALLQQSYRDFELVVFDDGSTDDSYAIAQEYSRHEPRIRLVRGEVRSGLVAAWTQTARLAGEGEAPDWFGWYADHDWVEPDWLERLLDVARARPAAVLVHASTMHAGSDGSLTGGRSYPIDVTGSDIYERIRHLTIGRIAAGDAVYGLVRYGALRDCGYFPREVMPDRLLVSELGLHGDIVCARDAVRYRRMAPEGQASEEPVSRQLRTLFRPNEAPVAPYLSHATYFLRRFLEGHPSCGTQPAARLYHALTYFYRHYNRFRAQCEAELRAGAPAQDLEAAFEFAAQASGGKLRVLYRDHACALEKLRSSQSRLQSFKRAYRDMHRRFTEQEERAASQRGALQEKVDALRRDVQESRAMARDEAESMQAQIIECRRQLGQLQETNAALLAKLRHLDEEKRHLEAVMTRPMRALWKLAMRR